MALTISFVIEFRVDIILVDNLPIKISEPRFDIS